MRRAHAGGTRPPPRKHVLFGARSARSLSPSFPNRVYLGWGLTACGLLRLPSPAARARAAYGLQAYGLQPAYGLPGSCYLKGGARAPPLRAARPALRAVARWRRPAPRYGHPSPLNARTFSAVLGSGAPGPPGPAGAVACARSRGSLFSYVLRLHMPLHNRPSRLGAVVPLAVQAFRRVASLPFSGSCGVSPRRASGHAPVGLSLRSAQR